jgi:hypothetical protein
MSAVEEKWKRIGQTASALYRTYHSKSMPKKDSIKGIHDEFVKLLGDVWSEDQEQIRDYIEKRKPEDEKLQRVQDKMVPQIETMLGITPIPASSFTAGTNILGDSDLDFNIPVPNMNLRNLLILATKCGNGGYDFEDIRNDGQPDVNYVFSNKIDGVDIEVKLNDAAQYMRVMNKIHAYLDNKPINGNERRQITPQETDTIAWIKQNLKDRINALTALLKKRLSNVTANNRKNNGAAKNRRNNGTASNRRNNGAAREALAVAKQQYKDFKALYYEHALFPMGLGDLLYPPINGEIAL